MSTAGPPASRRRAVGQRRWSAGGRRVGAVACRGTAASARRQARPRRPLQRRRADRRRRTRRRDGGDLRRDPHDRGTDRRIGARRGRRRDRSLDPVGIAPRDRARRDRRLTACGVDAPVVVGGIIPEEDRARLLDAGVSRVYTPSDFDLTRIMGTSPSSPPLHRHARSCAERVARCLPSPCTPSRGAVVTARPRDGRGRGAADGRRRDSTSPRSP